MLALIRDLWLCWPARLAALFMLGCKREESLADRHPRRRAQRFPIMPFTRPKALGHVWLGTLINARSATSLAAWRENVGHHFIPTLP